MRKLVIFIILLVFASHSWAQSRLGFTTDAGLTWQLDDCYETRAKTGGAVSLYGVYHFQYQKFVLQFGVGASEAWMVQGIRDLHSEVRMLDTENMPYTLQVDLSERTDVVAATELVVPFMLGLKVEQFYIMMGAKFAVTLAGKTHQKVYLTTRGDYGDRYYGPFENMPQHGYYDKKMIETHGEMIYRPDLRICIESGWTTPLPLYAHRSVAPRLQLGAYVEYGVLNLLDKDNEHYVEMDYSQYTNVNMNHIYSTFDRGDIQLNNLRVGVRATFLFPVRTREERRCGCTKY